MAEVNQLPSNVQAEELLIAKLLLDPNQIPLLSDKLAPEHFYLPDHRLAYSAMLKLSQKGKSIDAFTISTEAGRTLDLPIGNLTPAHSGDVGEYANAIRAAAFQRQVIAVGDKIQRIGFAGNDDALARVQDEVTALVRGAHEGNLLSPHAAVDEYLKTLAKRQSGGMTGLRYGMKPLDDRIQPASGGDMIILAARPSVGKTAFAETIADNWASQTEYPILFVSLEMRMDQLFDRAVSRSTSLPAQKIIRGQLDTEDYNKAVESAEQRRNVDIWYLPDPYADTSAVRAAAAKTKLIHGGIGGIAVDYLQLLTDKGEQEVQRVTRISRNLKAMAMEFACPILVLSQLNRAVEMRDDKHPKLYDLRESGAIEQDADVVLGLSRQLGTSNMDVEVLKNRNGELAMIPMWFDPTRVKFTDEPAFKRTETVKRERRPSSIEDVAAILNGEDGWGF